MLLYCLLKKSKRVRKSITDVTIVLCDTDFTHTHTHTHTHTNIQTQSVYILKYELGRVE